jgi:putative NADH-flavin reductase
VRLAIFGATGGTGRAAVELAAQRGDEVTAFARRPDRLAVDHLRVRVVRGDALESVHVAEAVRGQDAVLSVLGAPPWRHTDVCSRGVGHIICAMRDQGVRRLVVLSSLGVGDSRDHVGWFGRKVMLDVVLRRELEDKSRMEDAVRASGLDWVIVRLAAGVLTNGPARGGVQASVDRLPRGRSLARADLAGFLVSQLTSDEFVGQAPLVA